MDIKEKIRKLLALATSPNENEARSAMLKAREMMAKHKMSEADFEDVKNVKFIQGVKIEEVSWTTDSGDIWMVELVGLICDEHCCAGSWATPQGTRTHVLVLTGMEDSLEVCGEVIKFAVGFVRGRTKRFGKAYRVSYAKGFVEGLRMAYEIQKEDNPEWGLVLVKPVEVKEFESKLGTKQVRMKKSEFDPLAHIRGQKDGMDFNKQKVIGRA